MPEPKIQRDPMPRGPTAGPPAKIIENNPAKTVAQALANSQKAANAAK